MLCVCVSAGARCDLFMLASGYVIARWKSPFIMSSFYTSGVWLPDWLIRRRFLAPLHTDSFKYCLGATSLRDAQAV
jgi:hypothetical protein